MLKEILYRSETGIEKSTSQYRFLTGIEIGSGAVFLSDTCLAHRKPVSDVRPKQVYINIYILHYVYSIYHYLLHQLFFQKNKEIIF